MSGTIKPILPPLHARHEVPPLSKRGAWQDLGSGDPLAVLARGLNTNERLHGAAADIVSVPDIWAQLTVFHNALVSENHPLHDRTVAEWRGLLASVALAVYRHPGLVAEVIRLSDLAAGRWTDIVRRLPPLCPLLDGQPLDEISLVRVDDRLIALAQPLTLLVPSRSLIDNRDQRPPVAWMHDGRFLDPLTTADLSREERAVLRRFLERLCQDLDRAQQSDQVPQGRDDVTSLLGLAREFLLAAQAGAAAPPAWQFVAEPARLAFPALPVFAALRQRERAIVVGETQSDLFLQLREPDMGRLRGVVLFEPNLYQQLGRPPGEVRVWKHVSLRMLAERPERLDEIRNDARAEGYLVVEHDDLFLPTLYRADGVEGDQGFEQHPPGGRNHLLPFSPFVLVLMDRTKLGQACRIAAEGGGGTTVDLQLSLLGGGAVTLSHHYKSEEGNEPPFALSVWPNFRAPWWGLHLGYSGATPGIQFVTADILCFAAIRRRLASAETFDAIEAARAMLTKAVNPLPLAETTWFRQDQQGAKALFVLNGAAEAAVLQDRRSGVQRAAGLLLMREAGPSSAGAAGNVATVGIDFGTTNTAVYFQVGSLEPEPLRMLKRHMPPYRVVEQSLDELDAELLPVDTIEVPFQTILRDRKLSQTDGRRRPFRDTLIYFAQRRKVALEKAVSSADDLFANLKWDGDQQARERIELFLAQVVLMAFAEIGARGVDPAQVSFRFSFPEAYTAQQVRGFRSAAENAVERARKTVMPTGEAAPSAGRITFQTESVAAAHYFIHRLNTPATEGMITFDIGGQTTDIAVVQSQSLGAERLAWRGSFQLAGRHLLIEHLNENRAILTRLAQGRPELDDLLKRLPSGGQAAPEKRLLGTELLVNSAAFAEALNVVLPTLSGIDDAERLRAVALVGLAGLFDYIGRTVRHLAATQKLSPRESGAVAVCLGGRASLLFTALLRSEDEQESILKFFTEATGGAMPRARLVFSAAPKQEVAYGLVRDDASLTGRVATQPLLGEAIWSGADQAPATGLVSALDMSKPWRIEQPVEFQRFLARLPELHIKMAAPGWSVHDLSGPANAELMRALNASRTENGFAADETDSSVIEPPFIVLLRQFVHRLAVAGGAKGRE